MGWACYILGSKDNTSVKALSWGRVTSAEKGSELLVNNFMQISLEQDNPNKSSALFYWLLMKYHWTHAVCLTHFSRNQLLCPKTLATFPLSGDFRSHARQPRNRSSFTNVHFWPCKYMGRQTNFTDFVL